VESAVERPAVEAVSFVPAVPDRRLWRGHNPALGLAGELSRRWQLQLVAALTRAGHPRRQRGLPLSERRRNVAGAFVGTATVPNSVVLVDDVYTTGATVSEAGRALRRAGCGRVEVVTFARALRHRGRAAAVR
jgi:predicted amidophosphoribosyltransferase